MLETGLAGKVVVITGGAGGIGRATAERFVAQGAQVVVWDLAPGDGPGFFERVNVADEVAVSAAAAAVRSRFGAIDVLVNNAGITRDAQLTKWKDGELAATMSLADFEAVMAVNLRGVFLPTRAVVPAMVEAGRGVILSASSVVGLYGNFGQTNYAASKFGVIGLTKTWARELGRYGIRVNALAPGFIATEMVAKMPEKVIAGISGHTPLGRLGQPDEVATTYVWLASDLASFIHGAVISVDGGMVIGT